MKKFIFVFLSIFLYLSNLSAKDLIPNSVTFGQTQQPKLWDYADNVDTLAFLNSL